MHKKLSETKIRRGEHRNGLIASRFKGFQPLTDPSDPRCHPPSFRGHREPAPVGAHPTPMTPLRPLSEPSLTPLRPLTDSPRTPFAVPPPSEDTANPLLLGHMLNDGAGDVVLPHYDSGDMGVLAPVVMRYLEVKLVTGHVKIRPLCP
eukprot:1190159-Prorocentrum_minimum.AAC.1